MNENPTTVTSRREFLKDTSRLAAASALAGAALPHVHAAADDTIRLALIGCGNRGCGAVADACESPNGPVKLVAMADFFESRLASGLKILTEKYPDRLDVQRKYRRGHGFAKRHTSYTEVRHQFRDRKRKYGSCLFNKKHKHLAQSRISDPSECIDKLLIHLRAVS